MVPLLTLTVDITSHDFTTSQEQFRASVSPSLNHLRALEGAFRRNACTVDFHPPYARNDVQFWSARAVVMISVGKARREHLVHLYQAIVDLIVFELPGFEVAASIGEFQFSKS